MTTPGRKTNGPCPADEHGRLCRTFSTPLRAMIGAPYGRKLIVSRTFDSRQAGYPAARVKLIPHPRRAVVAADRGEQASVGAEGYPADLAGVAGQGAGPAPGPGMACGTSSVSWPCSPGSSTPPTCSAWPGTPTSAPPWTRTSAPPLASSTAPAQPPHNQRARPRRRTEQRLTRL